jgi:hypothetical protein
MYGNVMAVCACVRVKRLWKGSKLEEGDKEICGRSFSTFIQPLCSLFSSFFLPLSVSISSSFSSSQDGLVGMATKVMDGRPEERGSVPDRSKGFFCS